MLKTYREINICQSVVYKPTGCVKLRTVGAVDFKLERYPARLHALFELLAARIVIMDGPRGTMIQACQLGEDAFRGSRFVGHPIALRGNNDVLNLTRPELISGIHRQYIEAGADLIGTNTFNANRISQADYGLESSVYEMNLAGARLAVAEARAAGRPVFVAGVLGPTNKAASIAVDLHRPWARAVSFDELVAAYTEQVQGLLDGGVDLLLVETVFDTLNAKAALFAITAEFERRGFELPVIVSATVSDRSGRLLNGQTLRAFWHAIRHIRPLAVGLNCGSGAAQMRGYLHELAEAADCYISFYPNAGLPDVTGRYTESPEDMARVLGELAAEGLLNIVGGCCGSTPAHIRAIATAVRGCRPRAWGARPQTRLCLSGLEPLEFDVTGFVNIGERTNVAGSAKFAQLIRARDYEGALRIARQQVENGAQILDVCVDDAMVDGPVVMREFLNMLVSDPVVARVPVMVDSSRWETIQSGLKCLPGKGVVNSLSLKDGEALFLERARWIRRLGAALVVMAVDKAGQAETFERKVEICRRAYELLTGAGIPPEDIIFDPNVFAVGTGLEQHRYYARDFIRAVRWIKEHLPGVSTSGGISNVSYAFRGNNTVRQAMNSVFLHHAIAAGLDMAIVNAGQITVYDEIPGELRELVEDVLLARRPDATERLVAHAAHWAGAGAARADGTAGEPEWRQEPVEKRLEYALLHGITDYLRNDIEEALWRYGSALAVIEGPLMKAMNRVGELFGAGRLFLPQVVKAARVMREAVSLLEARLAEHATGTAQRRGRVLLATVKGDVHDIGKNIVGTVLSCNGFEVIDLGIMVPAETIASEARRHGVDMVGLSGLITPSLEEMVRAARELERQGLNIPLLVGGAATSKLHTAVRIAPAYRNPVVHVPDASRAVQVAGALVDPVQREKFWAELRAEYDTLRAQLAGEAGRVVPLVNARERAPRLSFDSVLTPAWVGLCVCGSKDVLVRSRAALDGVCIPVREFELSIKDLVPFIDWTPFFHAWELHGRYPEVLSDPVYGTEARRLFADAQAMLDRVMAESWLQPAGVLGVFPAVRVGDDIEVRPGPENPGVMLHFFRDQQVSGADGACWCLADFVAGAGIGRTDHVGAFALTVGHGLVERVSEFKSAHDNYHAIMLEALADRLVEAFSELAHRLVTALWFGHRFEKVGELANLKPMGIRPAVGYPMWPDHSEKLGLWRLLSVERLAGIKLTQSYMMVPASSVCGLYLMHPQAQYFSIAGIGEDQLRDYAVRSGKGIDEVRRLIQPFIVRV